MNLLNEENKEHSTEKNQVKTKKMVLMLIAVISTVVVILAFMILIMKIKIAKTIKSSIVVDGEKIEALDLSDIIIENETMYFPIKDIAENMGYKSYNGEYRIQTEDTDKCYIMNAYESTSFFEGKAGVYKVSIESDTTDSSNNSDTNIKSVEQYKEYEIKDAVKNVDGKLYVSEEGLSKACNVVITYDEENENVFIDTLDGFEAEIEEDVLEKKGYVIPEVQSYENRKAILKDLIIVQGVDKEDEDGNVTQAASDKYGIIDIEGNEILGLKYKNIEYDAYNDAFTVTDASQKVGIWRIGEDNKSSVIISNKYDSVELIDKNKGLYEVSSNGKYGIIDEKGKNIVGIEYEQIGLETDKYVVDNKNIVFENLIPLKKNGKWGVINLEGNTIIPFEYDQIGSENDKNTEKENIAIIQEYGLFVLKKGEKYGLINWEGQKIIGFSLSSVYFSNETGERRSYMEADGKKYDIVKYLDDNGTIKKYEQEKKEDSKWDF